MKQYAEIRDIVVNQLGIKDRESFCQYQKQLSKRFITQEEIELLSPDNINNSDFWRFCEEVFQQDAICGSHQASNRAQTNWTNLTLARKTGITANIDNLQHYDAKLLEIGAGYGGLKEHVEKTKIKYTGTDVWPKIEGIIQNKPDGLLPDGLKKQRFNLIVSTNVFQHLSIKQRRLYYKDIFDMLIEEEANAFMVNNMYMSERSSFRDSQGNQYAVQYGQFTQIQSIDEIEQDLVDAGFIIDMIIIGKDNGRGPVVGFNCIKPKSTAN